MSTYNNDLQDIKETIQLYIDGIHNGDTSLLKKAFHPQAMMYGTSPNNITIIPIEGLYSFVETCTPPVKSGDPHRCSVISIKQSGNMAAVEMTEEETFGHNYVNYFQLLKIEEQWIIVSKIYNATLVS